MTVGSDRLASCPFCGKTPADVPEDIILGARFRHLCGNIIIEVDGLTRKTVTERWNTRCKEPTR